MLTASSNESCAAEIETGKRIFPSAEPLDAGRLTGTAGSSKEARQKEERRKTKGKRGSHTRVENENAAEGACLSRRPSWAFYIGVSICRYKIVLVYCDTSVVSKFKIQNEVTLL
jgi:hypothetical protein